MDYMNQAYAGFCQVLDITLEKFVLITLIISIGFLARKIFSRLVMNVIHRFASNSTGALQQKYLVGLMHPLSLVFVIASFHLAGLVAELPIMVAAFYQNVLKTLTTFAFFWGVYSSVRPLFVATNKKSKNINDELRHLLSRFIEILIIVLGILSIMQIWGVDVGAFLAGLGILGMAFGFAAQDTIKNFFGCVAILMDKTFQKGHWIKTSMVEGTVEQIGFRTTVIRQFDKALVHIPNAKLADAAIINFNKRQNRRVRWVIGLTYETPTAALERIIQRIRAYLEDHPGIETDPKKVTTLINLDQFGDSAVELFCYFFTNTTNWAAYMSTKEECMFAFKEIIESEGSSIAYPTQTLHVSTLPGNNNGDPTHNPDRPLEETLTKNLKTSKTSDRPQALFDQSPSKDSHDISEDSSETPLNVPAQPTQKKETQEKETPKKGTMVKARRKKASDKKTAPKPT